MHVEFASNELAKTHLQGKYEPGAAYVIFVCVIGDALGGVGGYFGGMFGCMFVVFCRDLGDKIGF